MGEPSRLGSEPDLGQVLSGLETIQTCTLGRPQSPSHGDPTCNPGGLAPRGLAAGERRGKKSNMRTIIQTRPMRLAEKRPGVVEKGGQWGGSPMAVPWRVWVKQQHHGSFQGLNWGGLPI